VENGTVMLNFIYRKELFFLPLGFALKVRWDECLSFAVSRLVGSYVLHMAWQDSFSLLKATRAYVLPKHFGSLRLEVARSRPARTTYQDFVFSNFLIKIQTKPNQTIHAVLLN
jgi:hypothetical protein